MSRRTASFGKSLELMLLRPRASTVECRDFCGIALQHHVAAVCVAPTHLEAAVDCLRGTDVPVVALISHPFGADDAVVKATACRRAIEAGAKAVEVVVDLAAFASGRPNQVRDELRRCSLAAREANAEAMVRAVIETGAFDDRTLRLLLRAVVAADVDMVVTSSGLAPEAEGVLDIELVREEVAGAIGIKAVRAARSALEVTALINAGATRVGVATADALQSTEH